MIIKLKKKITLDLNQIIQTFVQINLNLSLLIKKYLTK